MSTLFYALIVSLGVAVVASRQFSLPLPQALRAWAIMCIGAWGAKDTFDSWTMETFWVCCALVALIVATELLFASARSLLRSQVE